MVPDACPWILENNSKQQNRELTFFQTFMLLMFIFDPIEGGGHFTPSLYGQRVVLFLLLAGLSLSKKTFCGFRFVNNFVSRLPYFFFTMTHMILKIENTPQRHRLHHVVFSFPLLRTFREEDSDMHE